MNEMNIESVSHCTFCSCCGPAISCQLASRQWAAVYISPTIMGELVCHNVCEIDRAVDSRLATRLESQPLYYSDSTRDSNVI